MIIVAGSVEIDPDRRAAALSAGIPQVDGARSQPGCLDYVWTADPAEPARVWVYERWESTEALRDHLAGPWYSGMLAVMAAHGVRSSDVLKHRVVLSEPVYDESRTPRADFFTEGRR